MSSDWQLEQTGVDRVARRLTTWAGSGFWLNGLRSKACLISSPDDLNSDLTPPELSAGVMILSWPVLLIAVDCGVRHPRCGALSTAQFLQKKITDHDHYAPVGRPRSTERRRPGVHNSLVVRALGRTVKRITLTVARSVPVFPNKRTFSEFAGMSQRCR